MVSNEIRSKSVVDFRLEQGLEIAALVGDYVHLGGGKITSVLIPIEQPVVVLNDNSGISRCKFALINFPSIWGGQDIYFTKEIRGNVRNLVTQHFKLNAGPWLAEITGVDSVLSLHSRLTLEGGSAVTHFGSITRVDGQDFRSDELSLFLEALHLFLSFARGSYCGLALLSGNDRNGKRVWRQWGTYKAEPWQRELHTWICALQSEGLSSAFAGLWSCVTDPYWRRTISNVVNWYLRSNDSGESEVSIILTQTALEHLAFKLVGSRQRPLGDWIASGLKRLKIDPQIPLQCKQLLGLQKQFNWSHGPHAIVELRNNLVHADNRLGNISSDAHLEAWNLGQRYIELVLLKLFTYTGQYRNRLKSGAGYSKEVEDVPWAVLQHLIT